MRHVPVLDGLRGIAILSVIIFHLTPKSTNVIAEGGWAGVIVFFVLSGFLITRILRETREHPQYFSRFYIRRALRILPLLFFLLIIIYVALEPGLNPLWYLTFTSNFAWKQETMAPLLVMWSLAIEEQFYLVWPVVIRYLKREHIMWLCLFMIVMAPLSRIVMVLTGWETWQVYMYTWCRVDAIALGALVALLIEKQDHPYLRPMARWMLASGLIGLAVVMLVTGGLLWDTPLMQTLGYSAFAALAGAFLVYGLVLPETHWWNRFLSWRLLTTYGMLCYGLYLTHYLPAKHLIVSPIPYVAMLAIGLPLTFVIGWGAYVLVERPFLRLKDRLAAGELRPDAIAAVPAGPAAPGAAAAPPGSDYQPQ